MSRWDDLLAVQEHDTNLDQLVHRRANMPERAQLDAAMASLRVVEGGVDQTEAAKHELVRSQQRLEDEIASLTEKATAHDKTLYSGNIANPRELQALQDEIAALKRRVSHLEDQQLELMEQIEPLDAELSRLAAESQALDGQAAELRGAIAEAEVAIEAETTKVSQERSELASAIDHALLEEYEALRPQLGGIAIARLVGGHCGGCHLALSAVEIDRLKKLPLEEPARCGECGRLLAR